MPTVAVVIPTRNRTAPLVRAVESVRRQTRPPDELIVVDDASEPGAAAAAVLAAAPGVRVLVNDRRRGAAFARNRGAREAASELVAFLDSDDAWLPTKLEAQRNVFAARPEVDLVYCDQWLVAADGRRRPSGKRLIAGGGDELLGPLLDFWTAPNTSTLMFRRASFWRLGGFDEALSSCQDHDLWLRAATTPGFTVAVVGEPLACFCFDQRDRITGDAGARMAGVEAFLSKWRPVIAAQGGARAFRRFRNRYHVAAAFSLCLARLRAGRPAEAWTLFRRYLALNPELYLKALRRLGAAGPPRRP